MKHIVKATLTLAVMVALAIGFMPSATQATTILDQSWTTNAQCGNDGCFGSTYQLIIDDGGTNDNNFTARLIVNASGYTPPAGKSDYLFISAVDFKPSNGVTSASLTAAPGGIAGWNIAINDGQVSGDCSGSGNGFVCSNDTGTNSLAPVPNATPYEWDFIFSLAAGDDNGDISFGHLGTRYCHAADDCTGVIVSISAPGGSPGPGPGPGQETKIPEPSSLILLGSGLVIAATALRRRFSQK